MYAWKKHIKTKLCLKNKILVNDYMNQNKLLRNALKPKQKNKKVSRKNTAKLSKEMLIRLQGRLPHFTSLSLFNNCIKTFYDRFLHQILCELSYQQFISKFSVIVLSIL